MTMPAAPPRSNVTDIHRTLVWCAPTEPIAGPPKRQFWLTGIRLVIVVVLVAVAATLGAIAYAPQSFVPPTMPHQLSCTPVVLAQCDALSPQTLGVIEE